MIWEQQKSVGHRCKNGQSIVRFSGCVNQYLEDSPHFAFMARRGPPCSRHRR